MMTREEVEIALLQIVTELPHAVLAHLQEGRALAMTESDWGNLGWEGVATKPTWVAIQAQAAEQRRLDFPVRLRDEARRRISAAYGEATFEGEIELRLRGGHTEAQDAERDRLRTVYKAQVAAVAAMTPAEIIVYDPAADSLWAAPAGD